MTAQEKRSEPGQKFPAAPAPPPAAAAAPAPPAALRELENIQVDLSRMADIASQLLRRVDLMAPDTVPHMLAPYQATPTRRGHIVVVEDDPANRAVITRLFQRLRPLA